jgi:hypothetical protein
MHNPLQLKQDLLLTLVTGGLHKYRRHWEIDRSHTDLCHYDMTEPKVPSYVL